MICLRSTSGQIGNNEHLTLRTRAIVQKPYESACMLCKVQVLISSNTKVLRDYRIRTRDRRISIRGQIVAKKFTD